MGLVEAWGTGIRKIMDAAKQCNLPEPEFIEMSEMFRINLYRKPFFSDALPKDGTETGDTGIETKKTGTETQGTGTEMQDSGTETQDTEGLWCKG